MVQLYERVRHISTGRFGNTLLVRGSQGDRRLCVLKAIGLGNFDDDTARGVAQEVTALARLRHPHLVSVVELFREGSALCVLAEYAESGSVAGRLGRARQSTSELPDATLTQWFTQTLLGLGYVHESGALHRDLRTRRLLLDANGHVRISGLAVSAALVRSLQPGRPDNEALQFLAPELAAGGVEHSVRTDVWSLGIILFEMLTFRLPFEHDHPRCLAERILAGFVPVLPPSRHPDLRRFCLEMLRREPVQRPSVIVMIRDPYVQAEIRRQIACRPAPDRGMLGAMKSQAPPVAPMSGPPTANGEKPRALGLGAVMGGSLLPTPRALRRIGEGPGRGLALELSGPKAALPKALKQKVSEGKLTQRQPLDASAHEVPEQPDTRVAKEAAELMVMAVMDEARDSGFAPPPASGQGFYERRDFWEFTSALV